MPELNLMSQGSELAVIGMTTVFFFLTTLVFAMEAMSRTIRLMESRSSAKTPKMKTENLTRQKAAAAAVAVHNHRTGRPIK
ncbi:MAG: OadG family protein [Pseudomonadota bacterium]|nr:OadG family protein [Pseudomonadota bacterium]